MDKVFVCIITGPAGAGKSTVAKELAKKFSRVAVINVDSLRNSIITGRVKPWPWNEESKLQVELSAENACALAKNFLSKGFSVVIDDVIGRQLLAYYSQNLKDFSPKFILLLPSKESLLKRFDTRGEGNDLRKRTEELHNKYLQRLQEVKWDAVIDSSNQTPAETVTSALSVLSES
jgi:adenylate kinase family enzyme